MDSGKRYNVMNDSRRYNAYSRARRDSNDTNRLYLAYDKVHGGHVVIRVFWPDKPRDLRSITLAEGVSLVNDLLCAKTHRQFFDAIRKCDYVLLGASRADLSLMNSEEGETVRCTEFLSEGRVHGGKFSGRPIEFGPLPWGYFNKFFWDNFEPADPEILASELYLAGPQPLRANLGKRSPAADRGNGYMYYDQLECLGTKEIVVIEPLADWVTLRSTLAMGGSLLGNIEMAGRGEKQAETILFDSGFARLNTPEPQGRSQFLDHCQEDCQDTCECLVYPFKKQMFRPTTPVKGVYPNLPHGSTYNGTPSLEQAQQARKLRNYLSLKRRKAQHNDSMYQQLGNPGTKKFLSYRYCSDLVFIPLDRYVFFLEKSTLLDQESLEELETTDGPDFFDKSLIYVCLFESDFVSKTQLEIAEQVVITFLTTIEGTVNPVSHELGLTQWGAYFDYDALFLDNEDTPSIRFGTLAGYLWHVLCYHQGYFTATCPNCGCGFIATKQGPKKQFCSDSCRVTYRKLHKDEQ